MDKSKTKRVGILSLFLREEDLAYYFDPDRWSAESEKTRAASNDGGISSGKLQASK